MATNSLPRVLSIAGSDSGGGAGIQADLKAFTRAGVYGMTAVTAVTAQNTQAVVAAEELSPQLIKAQIEAVVSDIGVDAVKVGMLGSVKTVEVVSEAISEFLTGVPIVVDPVMVAESGARLLAAQAESALRELILPQATVITPNVPEARALAGNEELPLELLIKELKGLGPKAVIITGGHTDKTADLLYDGQKLTEIPGERYPDGAAHGSGCTHSATLAARLACGDDLLDAALHAKATAAAAVRDGLKCIGQGAGPVDVFALTVELSEAS